MPLRAPDGCILKLFNDAAGFSSEAVNCNLLQLGPRRWGALLYAKGIESGVMGWFIFIFRCRCSDCW